MFFSRIYFFTFTFIFLIHFHLLLCMIWEMNTIVFLFEDGFHSSTVQFISTDLRSCLYHKQLFTIHLDPLYFLFCCISLSMYSWTNTLLCVLVIKTLNDLYSRSWPPWCVLLSQVVIALGNAYWCSYWNTIRL